MRKPLVLLSAFVVAMLPLVGPAQAQLDWRRVVPPRIDLPRGLPDVIGPRGVGPHRNLIPSSSLRRALGVVAVAVVGAAILSSLSDRQRREVSHRVERIVHGPRDREVVESYEIGKKKRVTITASPAAPKCTFKDEASLKPTSASGVSPDEKPKTPSKHDAKDNGGTIAFEQVPQATQCRRVETQVAELGNTKSDAPSAVETNVAVVCELTQGDWQPTQFSPAPPASEPASPKPGCPES